MKVYQKPRYHERRWKDWIEPLVPKDGKDRLVLDLGCNAGFYMRKVEKLGYKTIGIENNQGYIVQAPRNLNIIQADITRYHFPPAYLTLMTCVHYHQTDAQVEALLHNLMYSTVNLLIMGRHRGRTTSRPDRRHIETKLTGWEYQDGVIDLPKFYSILYKSPRYQELDVDDLYQATRQFVSTVPGFLDFVPAFEEFVRKTLGEVEFDYGACAFAAYFRKRRLKYPQGRCWIYRTMVESIRDNGLSLALKVQNGHIKDGFHRLIILRELGVKRVICRVQR